MNRIQRFLLLAGMASAVSAMAADDFGLKVDQLLGAQALKYFGVTKPLSSSATIHVPRQPGQTASDLVALAPGLSATLLTRKIANTADMFAFWPSDENPTHLIWCIEGSRQTLPNGKLNPSVQAIDLATGQITTILRGMTACDGIRRTPWGTILATEETSSGGAYEILNPLAIQDVAILNRATGAVTHPEHVVKRTALPTMAWEGIAILPSGVVIAGDELRPGTGVADRDGGAIFKFVPAVPRTESTPISNLSQSPLAAGTVYALQVTCLNDRQQYGQGCEIGKAAWVPVSASNARVDAHNNGATGYYRPEDLERDPSYNGPGVRFCWTNTGNEDADNYAEVICGIDSDPLVANPNTRSVTVNRFIEGDLDFNSFDNLAFQPGTGILYVVEDHDFGDIFACLPDGEDRDLKSDGCIKVLSVKDQTAEPTGFGFTADGKVAILSIQHSDDSGCPAGSECGAVDGYPTDDLVVVRGFKILPGMMR